MFVNIAVLFVAVVVSGSSQTEPSSSRERFSKTSNPALIGDIALTLRQLNKMLPKYRRKRKFVADETFKWELPIRYYIDDSFTAKEARQIRNAIKFWEQTTCITFRQLSSEQLDHVYNYLYFIAGSDCWSFIGYKKPRQELSLAPNCFEHGIILHEIGHALGFWHEQSRPDRDRYVTVHLENVDSDEHFRNFDKALWGDLTTLTIPYDLGSIMHYGPFEYNKANRVTMTTNDGLMQHVIGQRESPSYHDIKQANYAYCFDMCQNATVQCENDGYPDPKVQCSRCRCDEPFSGITCSNPSPRGRGICGGTVRATPENHIIESPGYPRRYRRNQTCSWIIQADVGSNVYIAVHGVPFGLLCGKKGRCSDYVEIRYSANLALPGPRYCSCIPPKTQIKSATNRLLVIFKSRNDGFVGFKATFRSGSCGGCTSREVMVQPACVRYLQKVCMRRWRQQVRRKCHGWWLWTPTFCGFKYEDAVRPDKCISREKHCCNGFHLKDGNCLKRDDIITSALKEQTTSQSAEWSSWSQWSNCTQTCGACGYQIRRRHCNTLSCPRNLTVESRTCNTNSCTYDIVYRCTKMKSYRTLCNPWYRPQRYCLRYEKVTSTCISKCCNGFQERNNNCIKQSV